MRAPSCATCASDPLIVRGEMGEEAVEMAVIAGHEQYDGDFEIRIGPGGNGSGSSDGDGDGEDDGAGAGVKAGK